MKAAAGVNLPPFYSKLEKNYLQTTEEDFYVIFGSISLWEHNLNGIAFLGHGGAVEEDKCISDYISYVINISPLLINQYFTCSDI